jgi:hypothetical protein
VALDLDRFYDAELHRLRGELLVDCDRTLEAAQAFQSALSISREQGAGWLELRAASSLARLDRGGEADPAARDGLRERLDSLPEAHRTRCAVAARELLAARAH